LSDDDSDDDVDDETDVDVDPNHDARRSTLCPRLWLRLGAVRVNRLRPAELPEEWTLLID
jgi:hypothetical protein